MQDVYKRQLFDRSITNASEVEQFNGNVVFEGIIDCAKAAIANDIPVVLGNDVGCHEKKCVIIGRRSF